MNWQIPLSDLDYGPEETQAVQRVLESRWLTMGAVTQEFEAAFSAYTGARHAVAVSNGTAALHLACLAAGIGPGDEVIVPSLSFVATANAVRYTGATVVFADICSADDLTIDPQAIGNLITPQTKAIIVMHYGGFACQMGQIKEIARQHGLTIIEDAAHAIGSRLEGVSLGAWGALGCFSFFSNKNMATGEGGMVITDSDALADKVRLLRSHGMTTLTWDRHHGRAWSYDVVDTGYNYRIDEIRAALGLVQLRKLPANNQRRMELVKLYHQWFAELAPQIHVPFQNHAGQSAYHIQPVLLPTDCDRKWFMDGLKAAGIQTSIHYPPIHTFSAFQGADAPSLPVTEEMASREVTLPLYPGMQDQDVAYIAQTIHQLFVDRVYSNHHS